MNIRTFKNARELVGMDTELAQKEFCNTLNKYSSIIMKKRQKEIKNLRKRRNLLCKLGEAKSDAEIIKLNGLITAKENAQALMICIWNSAQLIDNNQLALEEMGYEYLSEVIMDLNLEKQVLLDMDEKDYQNLSEKEKDEV